MSTRNTGAVKANLLQYGANAPRRAQKVVFDSGTRSHETSLSLCPFDVAEDRDDFHMIDHLDLKFTPGGFGYEMGFEESDFAAAGQDFYPVYVIFGTRYMPARDFLFAPNEGERIRFTRDLREALRPRRPETRGV